LCDDESTKTAERRVWSEKSSGSPPAIDNCLRAQYCFESCPYEQKRHEQTNGTKTGIHGDRATLSKDVRLRVRVLIFKTLVMSRGVRGRFSLHEKKGRPTRRRVQRESVARVASEIVNSRTNRKTNRFVASDRNNSRLSTLHTA